MRENGSTRHQSLHEFGRKYETQKPSKVVSWTPGVSWICGEIGFSHSGFTDRFLALRFHRLLAESLEMHGNWSQGLQQTNMLAFFSFGRRAAGAARGRRSAIAESAGPKNNKNTNKTLTVRNPENT